MYVNEIQHYHMQEIYRILYNNILMDLYYYLYNIVLFPIHLNISLSIQRYNFIRFFYFSCG